MNTEKPIFSALPNQIYIEKTGNLSEYKISCRLNLHFTIEFIAEPILCGNARLLCFFAKLSVDFFGETIRVNAAQPRFDNAAIRMSEDNDIVYILLPHDYVQSETVGDAATEVLPHVKGQRGIAGKAQVGSRHLGACDDCHSVRCSGYETQTYFRRRHIFDILELVLIENTAKRFHDANSLHPSASAFQTAKHSGDLERLLTADSNTGSAIAQLRNYYP